MASEYRFPVRRKERNIKVPDPFVDIASTKIPRDIKKLFKLLRYYFYMDDVVRPIITKLAEYPVTDIIFDEDDDKLKEKYEDIFLHKLGIHSFLIESRLDMITFGNCFVSIYYPFRRELKCTSCKESLPIEKTNYKWRNMSFHAKCHKCGHEGVMEINDIQVPDIKKVNLIRWNPEDIDIYYNPISGESTYWYSIPARIKGDVNKGVKESLKTLPKVFIDAIKTKKKVKFGKNFYHFKSYKLSDDSMGWARPILLPALKDAWLLQIVKKNIEMICTEGILPLDILFPQTTESVAPHQFINLGKWRAKLENEIEHWRQDKNYIPIMPIPTGWQRILGQQNVGQSVQLVDQLVKLICGAVGLPMEFIYGGINYSGSNISLRIVENHFIRDREDLLGLSKFIITNVSNFLKMSVPDHRFADFKMADDIQKRAQMDQLNQRRLISNQSLLSEYGISSKSEKDIIKQELKTEADIQTMMAKMSAESEGESGLIRAKNQIKLQQIMSTAQQNMGMTAPPGQEAPQGQIPAEAGGAPQPQGQPGAQGQPPPQEQPKGQVQQPQGQFPDQQEQPQGQDPKAVASEAIKSIKKMGGIDRELALQNLKMQNPEAYKIVLEELQKGQTSGQPTDMRKSPEVKPPRRAKPAV